MVAREILNALPVRRFRPSWSSRATTLRVRMRDALARELVERLCTTGSGVVRLPVTSPEGALTPSVPRLAAWCPAAAQICRVNETTDVFPLVPVTATIVSG
jgi:hypothetical protein